VSSNRIILTSHNKGGENVKSETGILNILYVVDFNDYFKVEALCTVSLVPGGRNKGF
jgi:hypothetical protein